MHIKSLHLQDFRNYKKIDLEFHEKVNLFLGNNAQGKTNLLEAIYTTSLGKSFRTSKDSEMILFGEDFCRIKVEAIKDTESLQVELAIGEKTKGIKIDGVKAKRNSDLLEHIYIVSFTPEDLKIVKEEPEKRRKFIDRELCQLKPAYYNALGNYKKLLMQRNALLKEQEVKKDVLEIWDIKMAEYGSLLMQHRKKFVEKINIISNQIHSNITEGVEQLEVDYEPSIKLADSLNEQKEIFEEETKKSLKKDLLRRTTGKGPHKDDLELCVNGIDIRAFGSQGQQRTAALSLKLAELKLIEEETGEKAVLLLDDVMSELDSKRQIFLISSLQDVQMFITTTELSDQVLSCLPPGKKFFINNGTVNN